MFRKPTNRTKRTAKPRNKWDEDRARQAVEQWRASGETVAKYARKHGLSAWTLYDWRKRLGEQSPSTAEPSEPGPTTRQATRGAFLPVRVAQVSTAAHGVATPMEVVLAGGRVVRVGSDFDGAALRRLVAALEEVS